MSRILKILEYAVSFYNNLPDEKKFLRPANAAKAAPLIREAKKAVVKRAKSMKSSVKRKGPKHSDERVWNHKK